MKSLFIIGPEQNGTGSVQFAWQPDGQYIATAGSNGLVRILDRHGQNIAEFSLQQQTVCFAIEWDMEGDMLAIVQNESSQVTLWSLSSRTSQVLESNLKSISFLSWSKYGPYLAVGDSRGNLMLYNKNSRKKIPVLGKHNRSIVCGAWSSSNTLALGSTDQSLTLSTPDGDPTGDTIDLRGVPDNIRFASQKRDIVQSRTQSQHSALSNSTISITLGGKILFLYNVDDPEKPVELAFQPKYGTIVSYEWFGDGYILIGFSNGYLVVISTHLTEIGEELRSDKFHADGLEHMAYSRTNDRCATCGGSNIKLIDTNAFEEVYDDAISIPQSHGPFVRLGFSTDGQILTATTRGGYVYAFLAKIPVLHDAFESKVAYLSSLREVTIHDTTAPASAPYAETVIPISVEPTILSLGPRHVVVGMNNKVWFHGLPLLHPQHAQLNRQQLMQLHSAAVQNVAVNAEERIYVASVSEIAVGPTHAAILSDGSLYIHGIRAPAFVGDEKVLPAQLPGNGETKVFPSAQQNESSSGMASDSNHSTATRGQRISCVASTSEIVVFGSENGTVNVFYVPLWTLLEGARFRHSAAIRKVFPNPTGTRIVIVDDTRKAILYNPVNGLGVPIEGFPAATERVLWDAADWGVFVAVTASSMCTFKHTPLTIYGSIVTQLGESQLQPNGSIATECRESDIPPGTSPMLVYDGIVSCQPRSASSDTMQQDAGEQSSVHQGSSHQQKRGSNRVVSTTLVSHRSLIGGGQMTRERRRAALAQAVMLGRFDAAWELATELSTASSAMRRRRTSQSGQNDLKESYEDDDERLPFLAIAQRAMEVLDVECALRVYRRLGDAGMVIALKAAANEEDQNLVAGQMALLFQNYALSQELFLASSSPLAALEMRRDLLQYEEAITLAETLAPEQVPELQIEHAKQCEFKGNYSNALYLYSAARQRLPSIKKTRTNQTDNTTEKSESEEAVDLMDLAAEAEALLAGTNATNANSNDDLTKNNVANSKFDVYEHTQLGRLHRAAHDGYARCLLRTGDMRRGIAEASDKILGHQRLYRECGAILESLHQYNDAAKLYQAAEAWEKAAAILIQNKSFQAVEPLMSRISAPKLHAQFAKAKEVAKDFIAAAKAYERARDLDNLVRLLVNELDQPERAGQIVRKTRSPESALLLSSYCQEVGDHKGAIEFLLIANKRSDAFALAMAQDEMESYVEVLRRFQSKDDASQTTLEGISAEQHAEIASFYEGKQRYFLAGQHYAEAEQYHKALKLYIQRNDDEALNRAIDVVAKADNSLLTNMLVDHLTGETDGEQKDPKYIFKLYTYLGNYEQAANTARIIAQHEAEQGKYRAAHDFLFHTRRDLIARGARVPAELAAHLELLHSYTLVKKRVKLGDHTGAAYMLKRVAGNLSSFPRHIVEILTSAVIECQRAGLKKSAFEYATMLMRPEHRNKVDAKFRRKIEQLVRRPKVEETEQERTACPKCSALDSQQSVQRDITPLIGTYDLLCRSCQTYLPYCAVSGKHMTLDDWSACPNCQWPALYSEFDQYLRVHDTCPMCDQSVARPAISLAREPIEALEKYLITSEERDSEEMSENQQETLDEENQDNGEPSITPSPLVQRDDSISRNERTNTETSTRKRDVSRVSGAQAVLGALGI